MTDMSKEAISTERALKLALEALESCGTGHISDGGSQWYDEMLVDTTIAVLREALASEAIEQPAPATELREQEPIGHVTVRRLSQRFENHCDQYQFYPAGERPYLDNVDECHVVYTSPPAQRTWVGLTEFDIDQIPYSCSHADSRLIAYAIEAKLREKNA